MDIVLPIIFFTGIAYFVWAHGIYRGINRYRKRAHPEVEIQPISIVIPFRNERENLPALLASLVQLEYPTEKFEVILVDDSSTDGSAEYVSEESGYSCLNSRGQGKKAAQYTGILAAKYAIIACTDADCRIPPTWLSDINKAMAQNIQLAFGPVALEGEEQAAQKLEFLALIGSTMAMLAEKINVMGNGANMAFKKATFLSVFPELEKRNSPSGDDVFLLHEMAKRGLGIGTLPPSAIVKTSPLPTFGAFLNQRLRWASKAGQYSSLPAILVAGLVFLINSSLLILALLGIWHHQFWLFFGGLFVTKTVIDYVLIHRFSAVFNQSVSLLTVLWQQVINCVYVPGIAILSQIRSYTWKDRNY